VRVVGFGFMVGMLGSLALSSTPTRQGQGALRLPACDHLVLAIFPLRPLLFCFGILIDPGLVGRNGARLKRFDRLRVGWLKRGG